MDLEKVWHFQRWRFLSRYFQRKPPLGPSTNISDDKRLVILSSGSNTFDHVRDHLTSPGNPRAEVDSDSEGPGRWVDRWYCPSPSWSGKGSDSRRPDDARLMDEAVRYRQSQDPDESKGNICFPSRMRHSLAQGRWAEGVLQGRSCGRQQEGDTGQRADRNVGYPDALARYR